MRLFVGDLVRATIPESYADIRKRANPQEERKDAPSLREEVKIIFDQFHEFLCELEHTNYASKEQLNSQIQAHKKELDRQAQGVNKNNMFADMLVAKQLDSKKNKQALENIDICKQELAELDQERKRIKDCRAETIAKIKQLC